MDVLELRALLDADEPYIPKVDAFEKRLTGLAQKNYGAVKLNVDDTDKAKVTAFQKLLDGLTGKNRQINLSVNARGLDALEQRIASLQSRGRQNVIAGSILTGAVTAPLIGGGAGIAKFGVDFQEAMQHVVTLTDVSRTELEGLHKQVLQLSTDPRIRQGPTELADALYYVTSTGLKGADGMTVLKAAALGASAGLGETKVVANTLTTVLDAYGLSADKAMRATDTLTQAVKFGKGEADAYAAAFPKVIAIAAQAGVSFEEVAAQLASATRVGLTPSESATALRQIFNNLIDPSEKARKAMKEMGTSVQEVRAMLRDKGLFNTLKDLSERTGGRIGPITELFGSIRALTGFLSTTGQHTLEEYRHTLNEIQNGTGATLTAAGTASETARFQLDKFLSTVQKVAIELSDRFLPSLTRATDALGHKLPAAVDTAIATWEGLPDPLKRALVDLLAIVAVTGPLKIAFGNLQLLGSGLGSLFGGLAKIPAVATALAPLLAFASNPYVLAILGGVLLVGGIAAFIKFNRAVSEAEERTKNLASNAEHLGSAFDHALAAVDNRKAEKVLRALQVSAQDADKDAKKLDTTLKQATDAKREIKEIKLPPNAEDVLLRQIDHIIATLEQKKIHLGIEVEAPPTPAMRAVARTNEAAMLSAQPDLSRGDTPAGPATPAQTEAFLRAQRAAQREAHEAAMEEQRLLGSSRRFTEFYSDAFQYRIPRALKTYGNNLRELLKIQDEYNAKRKTGWEPSGADVDVVAKLNERVKALREKVGADAEKRKKLEADAAAEAETARRRAAEETANRLRAIEAKSLQQRMQMWETYGNAIEGVLGRIQQVSEAGSAVSEKTARSRMEAEMMKRVYDGIPRPLKDAAIELAGIEYRMKRIVDTRDSWRGVFGDIAKTLRQAGVSTRELESFAAQTQSRLRLGPQMAQLQQRANVLGTNAIGTMEAQRAALQSRQEVLNEAGRKSGEVYADVPGTARVGKLPPVSSSRLESLMQEAAIKSPVEQSCAWTASYVMKKLGLAFKQSARAADLERNLKAAGWQRVRVEDAPPGAPMFTNPQSRGTSGHAVISEGGGHYTGSSHRRFQTGTYRTGGRFDPRAYVPPAGIPAASTPPPAGGKSLADFEKSLVALPGGGYADSDTAARIARITGAKGTATSKRIASTPALPAATPPRPAAPRQFEPLDERLMPYGSSMPRGFGGEVTERRMQPGETREVQQAVQERIRQDIEKAQGALVAALQGGKKDEIARAANDLRKLTDPAWLWNTRKWAQSQDIKLALNRQTDLAAAAIKDMGREIRLIGQENNPLAALLDSITHGGAESRAMPAAIRAQLEMTLGLAVEQTRQASKQFRYEQSRQADALRENMGMLDRPDFTSAGYERKQQATQVRFQVWDSPDIKGMMQAADALDKIGAKGEAARKRAFANQQAEVRISAALSLADVQRSETALRGYAERMQSQREELSLLEYENDLIQKGTLSIEARARAVAIEQTRREVTKQLEPSRITGKTAMERLQAGAAGGLTDVGIAARAGAAAGATALGIDVRQEGQQIDARRAYNTELTRSLQLLDDQRALLMQYPSYAPQLQIENERLNIRNRLLDEFKDKMANGDISTLKPADRALFDTKEQGEIEKFTRGLGTDALREARSRVGELERSMASAGDTSGQTALEFDLMQGSLSVLDEGLKANLRSFTEWANSVIRGKEAVRGARDETLAAQKDLVLATAHTAAERLRIEFDYQDAVRRAHGETLDPASQSTLDTERQRQIELATMNETVDRVRTNAERMRDDIAGGISEGFDKGAKAGMKSFIENIRSQILGNLAQGLATKITNGIFGTNLEKPRSPFEKMPGGLPGGLPTTGGFAGPLGVLSMIPDLSGMLHGELRGEQAATPRYVPDAERYAGAAPPREHGFVSVLKEAAGLFGGGGKGEGQVFAGATFPGANFTGATIQTVGAPASTNGSSSVPSALQVGLSLLRGGKP